MSDCSVTSSETTASGSQEPTGVSVPIVGSSATDGMSPWENENSVSISSSLPVLSVCNDTLPTNIESSLTSASQITTPIPHPQLSDSANSHSLVQSGIGQHPDSTSSTLSSGSICDSNRALVDSSLISNLSIHSLGSQEPEISLSEQQIPDNGDHLEVIDGIDSQQHFLTSEGSLRANILDASSSFHHPESSDMVVSSDVTRSNLAQNLSALDQSSVSSTQESESLDMQNLLQEQHELNSTGSVSALSEYHLEQSETSQLSSVGSSSQLDMGASASGDLKGEGLCLSPSSSAFQLPSGMRLSTGAGLPPVSTIIRSSSLAAVKERFEEFCPTTSIGIGMGLPPLLSNSGTFTALSSIDSIQQSLASSVCDSLTVVTLASPSLPVSSAGLDASCTTLMDTESVDVPHSSTMASSSSGDPSVSHTISIKPSSSVMTSLGPQTLTKGSDLSDINEPHLQQRDELHLSLSPTEESLSPFPGTVPLEESMNIGASTTQVSLQVPSVHIEQDQTVAAFMSQNRTEASINRTYALTPSTISLHHTNTIKPAYSAFAYTQRIRPTNCLAEENSHTEPQAISVSAIETNVIMSTSNIDTTSSSTNITKDFETSHIVDNHEISSLNIDDQLETVRITQEMVASGTLENTRNSGIISDSAMQSLITGHHIDVPSTFGSEIGQCSLISPSSESSSISEDIVESSKALVSDIDSQCVEMTENVIAMSVPLPDSVATSTQTQDDHEGVSVSLESTEVPSVSVATSAIAASVIQQLLTTEPPQKKLRPIVQHITGGVITSVIGTKVVPTTLPPSRFLVQHNQAAHSFRPVNSASEDALEPTSPNTAAVIMSEKNLLLADVSDTSKAIKSETALTSETSSLSSELPTTSSTAPSPLPSLVSTALPSLQSTLKLGSLASFQASLASSSIPSIPMTSSLPNVSQQLSVTTVSLLPSVQSGLVTAPIPAVPPILLPSILSSSLASAVSNIKTPVGETVTSSESTIAKTANVYSGLLKTGLPTVVKQEPGTIGSGPLPPFTVVSGLSPLVKRDLSASLANILLGTRSAASASPITAVRIKQEPGVSTTTEASASEFSPTNVLGMDLLPSLSTLRLPSVAPVGLPVVATTVVSSLPSFTSPVPSQASTITFAENNTATAVTTASVMTISTSAKDKETDDKKLFCLMCKNGNPCGVHPTHGNSSQTSAQPLPSGDPAKPFQCNLCGKHLASKNVFQLHMRSHSGEKPFTCNLCGHHFSQKTSLTRHMRSHTGERPFPCDVCGKRFADKERIKIHMRTHTGEKPFACEVCGKRFSQKSTVKRHMSVHTGEKPFKCETCGKGFANRGNLNAHSKTHANT